jgi:serine/threonine protein kinase
MGCAAQLLSPVHVLLPQGLDYLHSKSIVHGDLKPDNMLLASDGRVKISDFGSARMVDHGHTTVRTMGTPAFLAPEMCEGAPYHGEVADIWALGICLYMFIYGATCIHMWHLACILLQQPSGSCPTLTMVQMQPTVTPVSCTCLLSSNSMPPLRIALMCSAACSCSQCASLPVSETCHGVRVCVYRYGALQTS